MACVVFSAFKAPKAAKLRETAPIPAKSELFLMKFSRAPRKLSAAADVYREKKLPSARAR
jgi:hypothetical protein